MDTITVHTSPAYDIYIGSGLLPRAGELLRAALFPDKGPAALPRLAVVTDDIVDGLYAPALLGSLRAQGFDTVKFVFPNGEAAKSHRTALELYSFLSQNGITRSDMLVALGGGVAGDLAGFAAATYLRGLPYVQVPTTLLADVDSSVGGKTAVNIPEGKNLVGAFWQPALVLCDPDTLSTLPGDIFCDGVAESLKYGAIFDEGLFARLEGGGMRACLSQAICRCVDLKRQVVEDDERDTGRRQLLNFGHTLGHAIERATDFAVSHGKAVGIGMAEITRRTEALGLTAPGTAARLEAALGRYGMESRWREGLRPLCRLMLGDKKRQGQRISFVILEQMGAARLHPVDVAQIEGFLCG